MPKSTPVTSQSPRLPSAQDAFTRWVLAIVIGCVLGAAIISASPDIFEGILLLPAVLVGILIVGGGELWVLRPYLGRDTALFLVATAIGAGWGALLCLFLGFVGLFSFFQYISLPYAFPLGGALFGLLTAAAQWLVLRRHFPLTGVWVPAHMLAGAAGAAILYFLGGLLRARESPLPVTLLVAALSGLVAGLITGWAMLRLVRSDE